MTRNSKIAIFVTAAVLIVDQVFKIYVKTHFELGEEVKVIGDWFRLHFVENNGMAFGMQLSGDSWGKMALSLFRLCAICAIGWYLVKICCAGRSSCGYVACIALV
ncbi:MAG: signal peptidase II, partial [Marinilabiliaceae bacterium]